MITMKKTLAISLTVAAMASLSACSNLTIDECKINKNGSGQIKIVEGQDEEGLEQALDVLSIFYSEDMINMQKKQYEAMPIELFNGKDYRTETSTEKFKNPKQLENKLVNVLDFEYVYAAPNAFVAYGSKDSFGGVGEFDLSEEEFEEVKKSILEDDTIPEDSKEHVVEVMEAAITNVEYVGYYQMTFADKVKSTNGILGEDQKTVVWPVDQIKTGKVLYAYTTNKRSKAKITGIKNNKTYKKSVTIKKSGLGTMYLDGYRIDSGKKVTQKGNHRLVVVNQNGKKNTIKFKVTK